MNCVLFVFLYLPGFPGYLSALSSCAGLIFRPVSHRYYNTVCASFAYSGVCTGAGESGTSLSLLDVCSVVHVY